jgi:hypothetical protein
LTGLRKRIILEASNGRKVLPMMLSTSPFDRPAIMREAHATVRAWRAGFERAAAAGYSCAKANLASFNYRPRLKQALALAWAYAKAARGPAVDAAEYASSFEAWDRERGRSVVALVA